jgi:cytochrome P450
MTLLLAGHETTATALTWTWYLISQHPLVEDHLHTELNASRQDLRDNDKMGKECGRVKRRKEVVTAPITLPRLDTATLAELRQRYEETPNAESRTRYQMILLAQQDYKVPQIARLVLRSEDTVARVLKRFLAVGLDAVPRRSPPGRERRVTVAWEAE